MNRKQLLTMLCALLSGLWIAGSAMAADVELWEGESTTWSHTKTQLVGGSVTAKSGSPAIAKVSKPKGHNAKITITGVKKGETMITVTGKQVVYNVGVNQKSIRTEVPFVAYISVVVEKPEEVVKWLFLKKREQRTINFPKKLKMISKTLKNSNKKVCRAHLNTNRKLTIIAKKKGTSTVTVNILKTEKGKTKRVKGIIYVEVDGERIKQRDNKMSMDWDDMFIGKVVILNGDEEVKGRKPKEEREKEPKEEKMKKPKEDS